MGSVEGGTWLSAGGCGSSWASLAGWVLWPDTELLHHYWGYQHKANASLLNEGSDFKPALVWQFKCPIRETVRGWRKQTPPSSWSSSKTAIPAPFSFACLILSVLVQPITQSQTGQLIIEMQKISMPYIDNVVLWKTKSQLLWLALAQKPHYPRGWLHITMSRKFTDQYKKHS